MSYLVFARKYRPQTFRDVIAQEHITRTLQNAVASNRLGSGYLFCGPRGTGKTTTARILAKALNCEKGPTPDPCGVCEACVEIAAGASLDVKEIDAASNTGVDDIRSLRETIQYTPAKGRKRVFIIDEVHRLSGAAFDALLKTLEEPPAHVLFIFATTEPLKVPETIISRTQRFDFRRVSIHDLAAHLKSITDKESLKIEDDALRLVCRKGDGSVRDSLSLLDQVAAFTAEKITTATVTEALGLVDRQTIIDFVAAAAAKDSKGILRITYHILDAGVDTSDFTTELLEHLRMLMVLASKGTEQDIAAEERAILEQQASFFSIGDLLRLIKIAGDQLLDLKAGLDERLILQTGALKMAMMESTVQLSEVLAQLKNPSLANPSSEKKSPEPNRQTLTFSAQRTVETPLPSAAVTAVNLPMVQKGWPDFLVALRQKNQLLSSQLAMATVTDVKQNMIYLRLTAAEASAKRILDSPNHFQIISETAAEKFGPGIRVHIEAERPAAEPTKPAASADPVAMPVDVQAMVKSSERLQKLLQQVDGEIIGIKNVESHDN